MSNAVQSSSGGGVAVVTGVSVATANGFKGSATAAPTPVITVQTTVNGVMKGDGTTASIAVVGTDYSVGTSALATGILKSTTATGALSIAVSNTDYQAADAGLIALAAFNTNGFLAQTANNVFAGRTNTAGTGMTITNGDGVSGNPTYAASANAQIRSWSFTFDGGGATLTTGYKGRGMVPYACTITGWTLLGTVVGETGSLVVDVYKQTYASFPPAVGQTITASDKPTITATNKGQNLASNTWTTAVAAGDTFGYNIDSVSGLSGAVLIIQAVIT